MRRLQMAKRIQTNQRTPIVNKISIRQVSYKTRKIRKLKIVIPDMGCEHQPSHQNQNQKIDTKQKVNKKKRKINPKQTKAILRRMIPNRKRSHHEHPKINHLVQGESCNLHPKKKYNYREKNL